MVRAVRTWMIGPLEKESVYPVAAGTTCHTIVNAIKGTVPYLITDLTE